MKKAKPKPKVVYGVSPMSLILKQYAWGQKLIEANRVQMEKMSICRS